MEVVGVLEGVVEGAMVELGAGGEEVTLMTCRTSVGVEVGVVGEAETIGVTEIPEDTGDESWLGLRGDGEGEEAGLSKQIIWGLTDPEEGGEKAAPPPLPPAGVSSPLVPLEEAVQGKLFTIPTITQLKN